MVIGVALVVGAAAYAFSAGQPEQYQADAQLAYGRQLSPEFQVLGPSFGEADVDEELRIATEAARINSFDVAEAAALAAPDLGYDSGAVDALVTASPQRGSLLVSVTARASSPDRAVRLVDVYVDQYLRLLREQQQARARIVTRALQRRLDGLPAGDGEGLLGATLRNQISSVEVLRRAGSGEPQVIQAPRAGLAPAQPQTRRNVLFGLLFGLAVGIGLVALRSESRPGASIAADLRAALTRDEPDPRR